MRVLITGAAGMIGQKLTKRLVVDGHLGGVEISALDLADVVAAPEPTTGCAALVADLAGAHVAQDLLARKPDVIFHLAGVVSGEAEADFDKGTHVNLDGTRALFDAVRLSASRPRVVFTSSLAVYGSPLPEVISDEHHLTPLTSYGTQKMIGEALLADYTRRGFMDGIGIRLPTISVRPGKPNAAASGFFSGIIREPLAGQEALLPVPETVVHPHASPRSAVEFLVHAAQLPREQVGPHPNLMMPAVSVSVAEQIAALTRVAGPAAAALIRPSVDGAVASIVAGWPQAFTATRARSLGFTCESNFDDIIQTYLDDDAPGLD